MRSRRQFVRFLAASPLFAVAGISYRDLARLASGSRRGEAELLDLVDQVSQERLITKPSEAFNVFDFEPVARKNLPPAHWGYLATGTDDDGTLRANREGFERYALRMRRLVDVSRVDPSVTLQNIRYDTPIVLNPLGSQRAFHPLGELGVARAARVRNHPMVLSTVATTSIEEATEARGGPVWFQLYPSQDWNQTRQILKRVEAAGAPVLVLTVDLFGGSNRETMVREALLDARDCSACHKGGRPLPGQSGDVAGRIDNSRKPMLAGLSSVAPHPEVGTPTWDFVKRLRDATTMKVWLKGIVTHEDGELAVLHGVDGLFVSNHGGRAENSLRASILSLPEVVQGVRRRIPIICDGGFRRGTDFFKGLALGATAVGIGRPYIWGLAAFGQEGVEAVLAILRAELELVMRQAGTTSLAAIGPAYIIPR